jgi:hypothetical protein
MLVVVILERQAKLFQVILTTHPTTRLARRLNGGEDHADQYADDRDHDEDFDQRKPRNAVAARTRRAE